MSPLDLSLSEEDERVILLGYEFMFSEYRTEKRKTKHSDPFRVTGLRQHLEQYQVVLEKLCPARDLTFSEL